MQNDNVKFKVFFIFAIFLAILLLPKISQAATFFVDGQLSANCTTGNYSIVNRACNGTDGKAYKTIASGVTALSSGDTMYVRAGTYTETSATGIPDIGSFPLMTTISGYQNETVIWNNNTIYGVHVPTGASTNNITIKNIHFTGKTSLISNTVSWTSAGSDVWYRRTEEWTIEVWKYSGGSWSKTSMLVDSYNGAADCFNGVAAGSDGQWGRCYINNEGTRLYIKSASDPGTRNDLREAAAGMTIGDRAGATGPGYIVIENNSFDGVGHSHIKTGQHKIWVKNNTFKDVGTDFNDHDMYIFPNGAVAGESIIEYNYFEGVWWGAAIHLYGGWPNTDYYVTIRYNIINSKTTNNFWGIANWGNKNKIYGNTIVGTYKGIETGEDHPDKDIRNNIIYDYYIWGIQAGSAGGILENNLVYSTKTSNTIYTGSGWTVSGNIINTGPSFIQSNPTNWNDFELQNNSPAINAGLNIGSPYNLAFDPNSASWPPSTIDQNSQGSGWEIGAFAYREAVSDTTPPAAPTGVVVQ